MVAKRRWQRRGSACTICGAGPVEARGWCRSHYMKWRRYGDPLGEPTVPTVEERFWAKVNKNGPEHPTLGRCWEWLAGCSADGYAKFRYPDGQQAHRYAYELLVGPIPDGTELDHLCRNRACVNPDHLRP